jgi:hypothetical protein
MKKNYIYIIIIIILILILVFIINNFYKDNNRKNILENFKEYKYKVNELKRAIEYNSPIEKKLNVIVVISNPCFYKRRYQLLKQFVERMENDEKDINLYIVELVYNNQKFAVTSKNNKNHLQLNSTTPLWHKENMINLGVKYLLPKKYKAFAWIDADIEFENKTWALDTLKILNGTKDVVQLFSHSILLNKEEEAIQIYSGFGHDYIKYKQYNKGPNIDWNPGFAWAITRKAYEKIGGLYDKAIIGGGDSIMAFSIINKLSNVKDKYFKTKTLYLDNYYSALLFQQKCFGLKLGYVPGVIRHYFHGTTENRNYIDRHNITKNNKYSSRYIKYDKMGVIEPSHLFPNKLKRDIMSYFEERKEDN